jgi:hypothetical protein
VRHGDISEEGDMVAFCSELGGDESCICIYNKNPNSEKFEEKKIIKGCVFKLTQ